MNTLAYADISGVGTSGASTIASTVQQLAVSFGVAPPGRAVAVVLPADHPRAAAPELIHGIHWALRALGAVTMVTTVVFKQLLPSDGEAVSSHKSEVPDA